MIKNRISPHNMAAEAAKRRTGGRAQRRREEAMARKLDKNAETEKVTK